MPSAASKKNIAYAYYTDSGCTANAVDQTPSPTTETNPVAPDSAAHTFFTAVSLSPQSTLFPYTTLFRSTSPCNETLVVQNHPSVATTLSDDASPTPNTAAGGSTIRRADVCTPVTDAVRLPASASDEDTIAYAYYTDSGCTLNAVDESPATNTVTNHLPPDSDAHTFATAFTFNLQPPHTSTLFPYTTLFRSNETLVVQNHPSVATTLSDDATPTPNTAAGGS